MPNSSFIQGCNAEGGRIGLRTHYDFDEDMNVVYWTHVATCKIGNDVYWTTSTSTDNPTGN